MVGGLFTELFVDFEGFLISLMFLLPLLYLALSLIGKWNYWTIAVSFVSAFIIGALSIFVLEFGFIIFPLIGWYIFYKSILRTLQMEVKGGTHPPKILYAPTILGVMGPLSFALYILLLFPLLIFTLFGWMLPELPHALKGLALTFGKIFDKIFDEVFVIVIFISLYIIYKQWLSYLAEEFNKSKFSPGKYALLGIGLLISYYTTYIQITAFLRG